MTLMRLHWQNLPQNMTIVLFLQSIEDPFENMVNGVYPPVRVMHQLQYLLIVIPTLKNKSSYPTPVHLSPVCASTVSVTL